MKIFVATLGTETNSFSPLPTGLQTFRELVLTREDMREQPDTFVNLPVKTWFACADSDGHEVVQSLIAFAQPAGPTVREVYEGLRDQILDDLRAAGPVDVVLLFLHGAMIAQGYEDCESDIVEQIRRIVGPKTSIGVELDLHCHLDERLLEVADVVVLFKEYPHTDVAERAREVYRLSLAAREGRIRPVMRLHDCRMLGFWRTSQPIVRRLVDHMIEMEQVPGVLSVSFAHGFPYGDTERVGAKTLVITDDDPNLASRLASELGQNVWATRHHIGEEYVSIDEGLDQALTGEGGPYVLADSADNAGGGAAGDSTFVLRRILDRGIGNIAAAGYWDPNAVRICMEAGVGAILNLRFGGKCGPASGDPIDLRVTVRGCRRDMWQSGLEGLRACMGDSVWIEAENGVDIVLTSTRTQIYGPDAYTQLGIDLLSKKIVLLKSTQHFYAAFAPIAKEVFYIAAPGTTETNMLKLRFTNVKRPLWPHVADPYENGQALSA
ncbi:M81 family metallopeptidase [Microvirga sp. BT689]|uniref:M81 family metallopeptidase n=1 Tax=Microvirga arvi TaxID=2778731 RepID=UPI00194FF712|nr:M81 family metallopeptidase [Microvirga arvi]MBM6583174.1 M81 family metallopeptidase [Microvirga arvi]